MREVGVIVTADPGPFTRGMAQVIASAKATEATLNGIRDVRVNVRVDSDKTGIRQAKADLDGLSKSARQTDDSINQLTGRLRLAADALAILGPAAAPIGALAVPAVTGLANQLGFAAAAGGTAILAFQGVGDAVGSMNEYAIEPTADNLVKVEEQLSRLSPQAADFAREIGDMRDTFIATRDAAAEGLFPELTPALDDLDGVLGRLQPVLAEIGSATGEMLADGLASLNSDRWQPFFDFLQAEAQPVLSELGGTAGDFAHGLAEMWMAFQPLNSDFSGWLRDVASSFDGWAAGLAETEGFNEFIAYVRDNGPRVAETLGALGGAILDIAVAAAPLGGPVLAGLEALADVLSAIASSDAGTGLIGLAGALALVNRAMVMTGRVSSAPVFAATARNADVAKKSYGGLRDTIAAYNATQMTAQKRAQTSAADHAVIAKNAEDARKKLGSYAAGAGKAAAAVGALTLVTTGAGESFGLQNTAMLGLAGTMAGPWGVAIGSAAGLALDLRSANDDLQGSMEQLNRTMDSSSYAQLQTDLAATRSEAEDFGGTWKAMANVLSFVPIVGGWAGLGLDKLFGDDARAATKAANAAAAASRAYQELGVAMGVTGSVRDVAETSEMAAAAMEKFGLRTRFISADASELQSVMARAEPTLQALGYTAEDLADMDPSGLARVADEVARYVQEADSAPAKMANFGEALNGLSDRYLTNAQSAGAMSAALQAMLSPTLDAEAASHQYQATLDNLRNTLNSDVGFGGATEASRANAAATRDVVTATQQMLTARAAAGAGEREIANLVENSRREFIQNGIAAGFSREQVRRRADALGLTPKLVRTTFEAAGIGRVERQARDLRGQYKALPKEVKTQMRAGNVPRTVADVDRLVSRYKLTERQRTALLRVRNLASQDINAVLRGLGLVDRKRANPKVDVNTRGGTTSIRAIETRVDGLNRKKADPKVTVDIGAAQRSAEQMSGLMQRVNGMSANPKIGADIGGALAGAGSAQQAINSVQGRTVYIDVVTRQRRENALGGYWPGSIRAYANGGLDSGDRRNGHMPEFAGPGPMRIWREEETGGESYVPHANDFRRPGAKVIVEQTARLFGGEVEWYAEGGKRDGKVKERAREINRSIRDFKPDADDGWRSVRRELKEFQRELRKTHVPWTKAMREQASRMVEVSKKYQEVGKALEGNQKRLQDRLRESADYRREVAGSINGDIFGNGLEGLRIQLEADRNDNKTMLEQLQNAEKKGLDGGLAKALYASGDLSTATEVAGLGRAEIDQLEKLFAQRSAAQSALGQFAEREVYAAGTKELQGLVARQEQTLAKLDNKIDKLEGSIERGAEAGVRRGSSDAARQRDRNGAADRKRRRR